MTMDWSDQPAVPAQPPYPSSPSAPAPSFSPLPAGAEQATVGRSSLSGARRTVATALLAVGLLTVGGVAVALAADPSATPAPTTTTQPSTGGGTTRPNGQGGTHNPADCPNMGGSRGTGTAPASPAAPSTDGSTSSPGSNL
jgi:type II secretory pathway pseudopilin PulG